MRLTKSYPSILILLALLLVIPALGQDDEFESIDSDQCIDCHDTSEMETIIQDDLDNSIHEGIECLDCHIY
ncbi:MAG: hypothetical protein HOI12_00405, partial [Candidatus Marinimicrobia bacterium]|nr:hypothetical protein [Candidatus Neomarinimicrobiota bacterium]